MKTTAISVFIGALLALAALGANVYLMSLEDDEPPYFGS